MEAIEGLLVITLMLFVLFYIWAFGFLMYQNWAVQYVATDTASRIAQTYGYSSSDPITGYISHATRVSLSPYRYKDDEEEKIQDVNANRAEKYAALKDIKYYGEESERKIRRPPPVYARRRSAAVGFWTRRCGGRDGRSGTAALSPVLCARYFCMVYGRQLANWRYFADKIRHNFQK